MLRVSLAAVLIAATALAARAQDQAFFYPAPPPGTITVSKDVQYGVSGTVPLMMDVYRPATPNTRAPALIFFDQAFGPQRTGFAFYARWGETAASQGLVGIVPDLRSGSAPQDFQALVNHLTGRAADYGIDPNAIAVYAGSGNVFTALPVVEDPKQTVVKAAVMYYGTSNVKDFRLDLPVLYVRAGLDRPGVNAGIATLMSSAVSQNAPVTLLNHATGHHGFEAVDDDAATRDVIDATIDFVRRATAARYQAALRGALPEATAAGHVLNGNFKAAASTYAGLVAARPTDALLRLSYGEALLGDVQFAAACDEFEKLKDKGLGARDLGLPAARACLQKGDADRALAWLQSIPQRFLPPDVRTEAVFAPLQSRPDFQALFKRD